MLKPKRLIVGFRNYGTSALNSSFGRRALRSALAWLEFVGRLRGEAVTRHLFKSNGGLRRSLSSGRAMRGPVGLQSALHVTAPSVNPISRRANHSPRLAA